jgi:hypothetical protein
VVGNIGDDMPEGLCDAESLFREKAASILLYRSLGACDRFGMYLAGSVEL